jgi:hypothetical protein
MSRRDTKYKEFAKQFMQQERCRQENPNQTKPTSGMPERLNQISGIKNKNPLA